MSELTEPQLRALKEIGAGHVTWSRISLGYWHHATKKYIRTPTMNALSNRGLIALRGNVQLGSQLVVLTDRGREVLADA